ncbi:MAG: hypothetical protein Q4G43_12225 [Mobilicoccus sp.]|nr:hypothetical protein [Mobilicoccus sp.]
MRVVLLLLLVSLACTACTDGTVRPREDDTPALHGRGQFTFVPAQGPSIPVFYAGTPSESARVVFVLHGLNRNAEDYRDVWADLVDGEDVLVVAPQFSEEDFPHTEDYNLGGLSGSGPVAFDYIEPLFDEVRGRLGGAQDEYAMYGHSAGAQFVHRFVEFTPAARLGTAVAANAGWYTLPDEDVEFPYGMEDAPGTPDPEDYLTRDLVVLLGADDVEDKNLRTDADAMAQGATRLERGMSFYLSAREVASERDVDLAWRLEVVPGVGHSNVDVAETALRHILTP